MRMFLANLIMWIVQPVLGPMIRSLDSNITQIIQRKIDRAEVDVAEDGTIRAHNPSTFVKIKPYEPSNG